MDHQAIAQLLGNYGEFVGAIAVVATLAYLAVQVRHGKESLDANTKAIRGQAISDISRNVHEQMGMIVQGHDVAGAFARFATDDELQELDGLLVDSLLSAVFVARQNEYFQWKQGLLEDDVFRSLHHTILTCLGSKHGQHWWEHEGRRMFAPGFIELVDELVRKGPSESLQSWKQAVRLNENSID